MISKNASKRRTVWGAVGSMVISTIAILTPAYAGAAPQSSAAAAMRADQTSMYQMVLVDRTVKAVKYAHRSGSTKIDFDGTDLMTNAKGEAKVDSHRGTMEIKVEFWNMQKPTSLVVFGFMFCMGAASPESRPSTWAGV